MMADTVHCWTLEFPQSGINKGSIDLSIYLNLPLLLCVANRTDPCVQLGGNEAIVLPYGQQRTAQQPKIQSGAI